MKQEQDPSREKIIAYLLLWKANQSRTIQCQYLVWFWRSLTRELIWHLSQSSIRPSIYFSSFVKSGPNPFLEPTSTNFLLKDITGAFDGYRTHDLHITSQTCNPLRHAARSYSTTITPDINDFGFQLMHWNITNIKYDTDTHYIHLLILTMWL